MYCLGKHTQVLLILRVLGSTHPRKIGHKFQIYLRKKCFFLHNPNTHGYDDTNPSKTN